mmetsp:Transcript_7789/g.19298  ORF Transcript_7789/g.19298 Transcript_7789/m.19298 type:complete len:222 (-) Transcript_7789:102-767(-)
MVAGVLLLSDEIGLPVLQREGARGGVQGGLHLRVPLLPGSVPLLRHDAHGHQGGEELPRDQPTLPDVPRNRQVRLQPGGDDLQRGRAPGGHLRKLLVVRPVVQGLRREREGRVHDQTAHVLLRGLRELLPGREEPLPPRLLHDPLRGLPDGKRRRRKGTGGNAVQNSEADLQGMLPRNQLLQGRFPRKRHGRKEGPPPRFFSVDQRHLLRTFRVNRAARDE